MAVVALVAVAARWQGSIDGRGARLDPSPDAVEYAAVAQSLARSGEAYLQMGPHRVRSRYPPGWPLLLAPAVLAGVPGHELWRVTALFGAALACLVAAVAAITASALAPPRQGRVAWWVAGLLGGALWALAPLAVGIGRLVMSDEPAAAAAAAAIAFAIAAFARARAGRRFAAAAAVSGLAWGASLAMRPIAGILLAPALTILVAGIGRGTVAPTFRRGLWRGLLAWALGAAVMPAVVGLVLVRSGLPAWEWSGYRFWAPARYGHWSAPFRMPDGIAEEGADAAGTNHRWKRSRAARAASALLGLPPKCGRGVGMIWPVAGWIAILFLARRMARQERGAGVAWTVAAVLVWVAGHLLFFGAYFFPAARFYLAPAAVPVAAFAAACGLGVAATGWRRAAASVAAVIALVAAVNCFLEMRKRPGPPLPRDRTRAAFTRWLKRGDAGRAGRVMPFDPVRAQALGLLTPEVAGGIEVWGELPDTLHVGRLRARGYLPRPDAATAPARRR